MFRIISIIAFCLFAFGCGAGNPYGVPSSAITASSRMDCLICTETDTIQSVCLKYVDEANYTNIIFPVVEIVIIGESVIDIVFINDIVPTPGTPGPPFQLMLLINGVCTPGYAFLERTKITIKSWSRGKLSGRVRIDDLLIYRDRDSYITGRSQ